VLGTAALWGGLSAQTASGNFVRAEETPHQRTFMQWPVSRRVTNIYFVACFVCKGAVIGAQFGNTETDAIAIAINVLHRMTLNARSLH